MVLKADTPKIIEPPNRNRNSIAASSAFNVALSQIGFNLAEASSSAVASPATTLEKDDAVLIRGHKRLMVKTMTSSL